MKKLIVMAQNGLAEKNEQFTKTNLALKKAPQGKIHISKCKNTIQYYVRNNVKDVGGAYISKRNMPKIKSFLQKAYDENAIDMLHDEMECLKDFINRIEHLEANLQNIYSSQAKESKKYITPLAMSDQDYINEWLAVPFTPKEISQELPYFETSNGEFVRSKSELNIANMLYKNGIPYKYECPILLGDKTIHPDFTILDVKNRCEVYWEHRGMMDSADYARHSILRIRDYEKNGIFLGERLVITEECSAVPLGTNDICRVIKKYFM